MFVDRFWFSSRTLSFACPGAPRTVQLMLALALLTAAVKLPDQLRLVWSSLPVIRLWFHPAAQHRLQLKDIPYDLLQAVDAAIPHDASVLLVTAGRDVRHREYTIFHRALYFLAPRPVWWLTPTPSDGTWESRWWIAAPLTSASVGTVAVEKGVSHVLAYGLPWPLAIGQKVVEFGDGTLLQIDKDAASSFNRPARPAHAGGVWLLQMVAALGTMLLLGYAIVGAVAKMGYDTQGSEAAALAWPLGAGLTSVGMLWLNALGVGLHKQVVLLTLFAMVVWMWTRSWRSDYLSPSIPSPQHPVQSFILFCLLFFFLALQVSLVTILAVGRPLEVWDSWVTWGMKARTIFLDGSISSAVYAEPSRAITHLDYPLLIPLVEAWLYKWLGVPDDRLVGIVSVLFYLALAGICYAAMRRRNTSREFALGVAVVVASIPQVALLAGFVLADVALLVFAAIAAVYLVEWLQHRPPGALVLAALAAGLLPWTKREGWVLLIVLCLATLLIDRSAASYAPSRRAWLGVVTVLCAAASLSGPWWAFVAWKDTANIAYLPVTVTTLLANLHRLPVIGWHVLSHMVSPLGSFIWPLSVLCALLGWRTAWSATGAQASRTAALLPVTALSYVGFMSFAYVFSAFAPYQQHIASSLFRLMAHVMPLLVLWIAYHRFGEETECLL